MCVIASIPSGSTIDDKTLKQMWDRNSDGAGIAWLQDGEIKLYKSMKFKPFQVKFHEVIEQYGSSDILVHMRIATCGEICLDNNHPFYLLQNGKEVRDTVFAHNGQLFDYTPPAKFKHLSDTRYFNELFWNNFNYLSLDDWRIQDMIGNIIGRHANKFVVLTANPALKAETYIINKHLGELEDNVWYSNMHHKPVKRTWGGNTHYATQTWDSFKAETDEDKKILNMIAERDPDACDIPIVKASDDKDDWTWRYSCDKGLYEEQLIHSDEFRQKLENLLVYTGHDTIEYAAEDMFFEIHSEGEIVCPECGTEFTDTYERDCGKDCMFQGFDPVNGNIEEFVEAQEQDAEDIMLARKYEEKTLFDI